MSLNVFKLLVVGESGAGKTSIIKAFLDHDSGDGTTPNMSNSDFSLKIVKADGEKLRMQLWDQGNSKDPVSTFQPLYTRHASGCIVVANASNA